MYLRAHMQNNNRKNANENEKKLVMAKIGPEANKFSVEGIVDDGMYAGFMPNFVSNTLTPKPKTIVVNDDDINNKQQQRTKSVCGARLICMYTKNAVKCNAALAERIYRCTVFSFLFLRSLFLSVVAVA